ncbi:hypothetical protein HY251_01695 [bacterium]|nr:hypothetical protein [bacterium]
MLHVQGAFGGDLVLGDRSATEPVAAQIAGLLAVEAVPTAPAGLVPFRGIPGRSELEYQGDLRGLLPLEADERADDVSGTLRVLARALSYIEELHSTGRPHGDLRPDQVFRGERIVVTFPARVPDAAALLRARIVAGAPLAETAFVAPEILEGKQPTRESDAFSAAAIVHLALTGKRPHGAYVSHEAVLKRVSPWNTFADGSALTILFQAVRSALDSEPSARPTLTTLREALVAVTAAEPAAAPPKEPLAEVALAAKADEPFKPAWGPVATGLTGIDEATKKRDTPIILGCLLAVGAVLILAGALWLVAVGWDVLGVSGRFALLLLLAGGIGTAGAVLESRGYARSGFALVTLTTQLLWAVGGYVLDMNQSHEAGPWAMNAGLITLATYGLAVRRDSILLALLGTIAATVSLVCLGGAIGSGSETGPAIWCFVCAAALAGLALLGKKLSGDRASGAPAAVAALFLIVSAFLGLATYRHSHYFRGGPDENTAFSHLWPYAIVAASAGAAHQLRNVGERGYAILALGVASVLLAIVPTAEALMGGGPLHVSLYMATGIGTALIVAAFKWEPVARDDARRALAMLVGLASVVAAPGFKALERLSNVDADQELLQMLSFRTPDELLEKPLFYFSYVVGTAFVLVGLGLVFARDAEKKWPYRLLEVAGLGLFFATVTVLALARYRELLYPATIFGLGALAIAIGAKERHLVLVGIPAAFLVLNAWIQYFAKLSDALPLGLLLIGFGIGLVAGGVLLERTIRPRIQELKTWR